MNSTSTADTSFTRFSEHKESNEAEDKENVDEEDGFKEYKTRRSPYKKVNLVSRKVYGDQCFIRNLFDKYGGMYIFDKNNSKIFISRMKIVNFPMNREIFDKGKMELPKNSDYFDINSIPELKFWFQRYYYYSKFDDGIKMDYESIIVIINIGWYSVTPEELAKYTAMAITDKKSTVVDAFCGSGGNVIQVKLKINPLVLKAL